MKKIFAVLAFVFLTIAFSSFVSADCTEGDCTEPAIPDFQEYCPDSNCDGAWGQAWVDGDNFAEVNTAGTEQVWAEECSEIEIGAIVGAPENGTASMQNQGMQGIVINSQRPDGSGGIMIRDTTIGTVNPIAENGDVQGGVVFGKNNADVNMYGDTWETGMRGAIETSFDMAAMACNTLEGGAAISSELQGAGYQRTNNGEGIETYQGFEIIGRIDINNQ